MTAGRAPVRTCTELYGSATSPWVNVSPQSELMGPSSADSALAPCILPRIDTELQSTCSCPSTPSPRLIRSKVSIEDLRRAPARCSLRPVHRSKLKVAMCSRADASHGLFLRHNVCRPRQDAMARHADVRSVRRRVELPYAPVPSCTAQPRACASKYHLNPSSWARAVPVSRLRHDILLRTASPDRCCN